MWNGSEQFPDKSFSVNRDVVRCWLTVSGERGKYFQFCEAMNCGTCNRTNFDKTVEFLIFYYFGDILQTQHWFNK